VKASFLHTGDDRGQQSVQRFLVLKLPRTGSTLLCDVLDSHPEITCVGEALNPSEQQGRRKMRATLGDHYRSAPSGAGTAVGVTINPFRYGISVHDINGALGPAWLPDRLRQLSGRAVRPDLKVIVLVRSNLLKQAVSHQVALMNRSADGKFLVGREHVDSRLVAVPKLDIDELRSAVAEWESQTARLRAYARALRREMLEICYEDLQTQPESTFRHLFDFLGATPPPDGFDFTAGFTKILSDDVRNFVSNPADLVADPLLGRYMDSGPSSVQ
jgi:LPS sulfotransferase NodH